MAQRPFEEHRYVGDKASMIFHDLSHEDESCRIDSIVEGEVVALFGPDQASEARNRGYEAHTACDERVLAARSADE